jgi:multiple sugar transport system substrate-binding protein
MPLRTRAVTTATTATVAAAVVALLAACCGDGGDAGSKKVLTYWASQQSPSVQQDKAILEPELRRFTQQTGIEVKLEVIPFTELLNKILTATTSGRGPDVLNIGNTWTPSLQASGALVDWDAAMMDKLGGSGRLEPAALATTGAEGTPPAAVPLYNKVYQLYYNKKLFAAAGVTSPPATWDEFVDVGKKLTKDTNGDGKPDQWGLSLRGQASTNAAHYAFILGSARGAVFFKDGKPTFDSPEAAAGIEQYLSWMGEDKIVNPSDAENADWANVYEAFAGDKAGMILAQTLGKTLHDYKLTSNDYGVAPMPRSSSGTGADVASFVGGTNVAVFKGTENLDGAVNLVKFLTSASEQSTLNAAYGTIPAVKDARGAAFDSAEMKVARDTIASRAIPMPRVPQETQFETLLGKDVVNWLSSTATGRQPSATDISAALAAAAGKVSAGG